ncbi:MAG: sigma-E processing peptidase SpoIIGA [Tissierellia bacterium]|nr:sigma-E processing peptidase SpoIIGA [Tissierellia bacterium]
MEYYIEYIFAENFFIDFMLLYITGNLIKRKIIFKRLIVASFIGAIYVILTFYIGKIFMTYFIVKFSISLLMLAVAFETSNVISSIRLVLSFYIVTLIMVGITWMLYFFTNNKLTVNIILLSIFMGSAVLKYLFYEIKLRKEKSSFFRTITIKINNKQKPLKAFIDTGNELVDPMTGKPVIIVNIECLKDLLEDNLFIAITEFYKSKDKNYINIFLENNYKLKLRVIRYNTISNKGELMICIVPDNVTILSNDKNIIKADAIIGIHPQKISQNDDYDALLFKKLLDWECENLNEAEYKSC